MDNSENAVARATTTAETSATLSSSAASPPPSTTPVILSPCAACRILRRRCVKSCVLAPYFPPTEPLKFTVAHRVFGASNIIKLLEDIPEHQKADAVTSMVYEATARLRDPVYGCAGAVFHLQKQNNELQAELAKAQAEILNFQCHNASFYELISKNHDHNPSQETNPMAAHNQIHYDLETLTLDQPIMASSVENSGFFWDQSSMGMGWE